MYTYIYILCIYMYINHSALRIERKCLLRTLAIGCTGLLFSYYLAVFLRNFFSSCNQGCGAGTGTGQNRIHLGAPASEPEPYSEFSSGSGYREMKQKLKKIY